MSATLQTPPQTTAPQGAVPALAPPPRDRYFDTEHLTADLRGRTLRGGAVTLSAQAVKFTLRLGSTAVLARLLTPADFGLIAMVTVVTGFVEMFKDAGLSMATVQRDKITHAQVSTLFWINVALSLLVMLAIAALAPAVAWFYGEPRLLPVTLALAATMVFGGLAVQHQALLKRNMRFGRLAAIEILSMAAGIAAAILMASAGFTYWALVAMTAVTAATTAALSFAFSGWMPGLPVRGCGVRPMLGVGGSLTGASLIGYFGRSGDSFIVGHFYGARALGLYNRALALLLAPWNQLLQPLHAVVEPALCRARHEPDHFKEMYQQYVSLAAAFSFPATVLLAFNSRAVITVFLGTAWLDAVPIFIALFPAALIAGIRPAVGWLFTPLGRAHRHLSWALFSTPIMFTAYLVGAHFGTTGTAVGFSLVSVLLFVIGVEYGIRDTCLRRRDVWMCLAPAAFASAVATIAFHCTSPYSRVLASFVFLLLSLLLTVFLHCFYHIPALWNDPLRRLLNAVRPCSETAPDVL